MGIRPLHDYVLIERAAPAATAGAGLIIPEMAKERPQQGRVQAIGAHVINVKPGDDVLVEKWVGTEVDLNGIPLLMLHEHEIVAVVEPDDVGAAA